MNTNPYAEIIKQFRKKAGLTQMQLAEKIGVNRTAITKYESGNVIPSAKILAEIFAVLNIPSSFIFDFRDSSTEPKIWHVSNDREPETVNRENNNNSIKLFSIFARSFGYAVIDSNDDEIIISNDSENFIIRKSTVTKFIDTLNKHIEIEFSELLEDLRNGKKD